MPCVSARCASSAAYSPGTEISATLASASERAAAASERGGSSAAAPSAAGPAGALSSRSAASSAPLRRLRRRSRCRVGPGVAPHAERGEASRFAGVPIATSARPCARRSFATFISRTLST